jgi:pyruvate dehydrogenase E2 component (dihydrolipoyllysine-residue acetyltransferase)
MSEIVIKVPDLGGDDQVEVIEVSVSVGEKIDAEQTLIVLESDKASMEIPASQSGVIKAVNVAVGDKVSEGSVIVTLEAEAPAGSEEIKEAEEEVVTETRAGTSASAPEAEPVSSVVIEPVAVPDLGGASGVEVIEVNVAVGDSVAQDDTLLVLESDKASMEIPSPVAGIVKSLLLKLGDKVDEGALIAELEVVGAATSTEPLQVEQRSQAAAHSQTPAQTEATVQSDQLTTTTAVPPVLQTSGEIYAGPAVRLMARELGVDLTQVSATGPKGRILKEDVQAYVKQSLSQKIQGTQDQAGSAIPVVPAIDFSAFGEVDEQLLSRIQKLTAAAMQRSWLNVPHVAHFDEADITDLEEFRVLNKEKAQTRELKLTPLPFLLKACAVALREHPHFNASLSPSGESLIYKKYCNIGIAMDTPAGLMVPVIRDVDKKGIWELAKEMTSLGIKGKEGKLNKSDLEGGCFTISSLGAIGGTGFTPIVNTPEVAILGVSRTQIKPIYIEEAFVPRKMLPLTLSYDHRAVNGVDAGQFVTCLTRLLADIRRLVM